MPPLLYFVWIIVQGHARLVDAGVLIALYLAYLVLLNRLPPKDHEEVEDVALVARAVIGAAAAAPQGSPSPGCSCSAALTLYFVAAPFLESMKGLAVALGVAPFVFVQWVAPFLSEFPEKTSAFYWARSRGKAPMALMNMVSSNINQWTVLAAMIPIVYSISLGHPAASPSTSTSGWSSCSPCAEHARHVPADQPRLRGYEAVGLFVLWFAQFLFPGSHEVVTVLYVAWCGVEIVRHLLGGARAPRSGCSRSSSVTAACATAPDPESTRQPRRPRLPAPAARPRARRGTAPTSAAARATMPPATTTAAPAMLPRHDASVRKTTPRTTARQDRRAAARCAPGSTAARRPRSRPSAPPQVDDSCAKLNSIVSEVASASPRCPSGPMRSRLSARFTATETKLARTGVRVSPSA